MRLGRGRALLAAQSVVVLGLAADLVAAADDLGGLDHLDIGIGRTVEDRLRLGAVAIFVLVLHQRNRFQATGHGYVHLAGHDAFGGGGDAHEARAAHAVYRHAADRVGQACGVDAQAAQVVALVALLCGNAQDDIVHFFAFNARFGQGGGNHVAAEHGGLGVVKCASVGFANGRARGGNDDSFLQGHGGVLGNLCNGQKYRRLMVSATQPGLGAFSISTVIRTTMCTPPSAKALASVSKPWPRTRAPTGTGAGKRTLSQP